MEFPRGLLYSEYHLWVRLEGSEAVIGISSYAKQELGEVDYIEIPQPGETITMNEPFGIVETSKAVTDLVAPISGTVVQTNALLVDSPKIIMDDPYGNGWLVIVKPSSRSQLSELIKPDEYERLVQGLSED